MATPFPFFTKMDERGVKKLQDPIHLLAQSIEVKREMLSRCGITIYNSYVWDYQEKLSQSTMYGDRS